jgi:hypothetical protein
LTFLWWSSFGFAELYPEMQRIGALNPTSFKADSDERKQRDPIKAVKQNYSAFISMSIVNLFARKNRIFKRIEIEKCKKRSFKTP